MKPLCHCVILYRQYIDWFSSCRNIKHIYSWNWKFKKNSALLIWTDYLVHKIDRLTFLKQNILAYKLQNKCDNNREPGHKLHEVLNVVVPEESHEHPEEDPREHSHHTGRNHHQGQQVGGARALVPEKPDYKNRKRKNSFRSLEPIFFFKNSLHKDNSPFQRIYM